MRRALEHQLGRHNQDAHGGDGVPDLGAADKLKLGKLAPAGFSVRSSKKLTTNDADVGVAEVDSPDGPQVRVGLITAESGRWDAGFTGEDRKARLREQIAQKQALFDSEDEQPDGLEDEIGELESELETLDNERTAIIAPEAMEGFRHQLGEALTLAKANKAKQDATLKALDALDEQRNGIIREFSDAALERDIHRAQSNVWSKKYRLRLLREDPKFAGRIPEAEADVAEAERLLAPLLARRAEVMPPDARARLEDLERQTLALNEDDIDDMLTSAEVSAPDGLRVVAEIWGSDDVDEQWVTTRLYVLGPGETTDDADNSDGYAYFRGLKGLNGLLRGLGGLAGEGTSDQQSFRLDSVAALFRPLSPAVRLMLFARSLEAWDPDKHKRYPKGHPLAGKFRPMVDLLMDAIKAHKSSGDDGSHPFDGFSREQLRKAAKDRNITLAKGASRDDIAAKLLDDLGGGVTNMPDLAGTPGLLKVRTDRGKSGDGWTTLPDGSKGPWGKYGASGVLLRHVGSDGKERFLMIQRGPAITDSGKWQFPGGAKDEKENAYEGAARETIEELALSEADILAARVHGTHEVSAANGWKYTSIAATVDKQLMPDLSKEGMQGETSDAKWMTREEIQALDSGGQLHKPLGGGQLEANVLSLFPGGQTSPRKADVVPVAPVATPSRDEMVSQLKAHDANLKVLRNEMKAEYQRLAADYEGELGPDPMDWPEFETTSYLAMRRNVADMERERTEMVLAIRDGRPIEKAAAPKVDVLPAEPTGLVDVAPPAAQPKPKVKRKGPTRTSKPKKTPEQQMAAEQFEKRAAVALNGEAALLAAPRVSQQIKALRASGTMDPSHSSRVEHALLVHYMGESYVPINQSLWRAKGAPLGTEVPDDVRQHIEDMDLVMNSTALPEDVVLFRGLREPHRAFDDPSAWRRGGGTEGLEWTGHAFSSSSAREDIAENFAVGEFSKMVAQHQGADNDQPTVMRILVPAGTKAIRMSGMGIAAEVLLPYGTRYRIAADHGVVKGIRRVDVEVVPND